MVGHTEVIAKYALVEAGEESTEALRSEGITLCSLPSDQERFGVGSAAADLERAEILVPVTVGHFRTRLDPEAKLIEIRDADRAITHPLDQMLPYPFGQAVPAFELRHLAAEDHAAELIAQAASRFGILLVAETLSQGKKLLLFPLLCVNAVLDQLQQHTILAQLSALGHATHLLRHLGRQADALTNRLLSHFHNTIMHQNGVRGQTPIPRGAVAGLFDRLNQRRSRRPPTMPKSGKTKRLPQRVLALPDLEQSKMAVLNSLTSKSGQRSYDHAITDFVEWYCSEPRLAFNRTGVVRYRIYLEQ